MTLDPRQLMSPDPRHEQATNPDPCPTCDSLESWEPIRGPAKCLRCSPPPQAALRFLRDVLAMNQGFRRRVRR